MQTKEIQLTDTSTAGGYILVPFTFVIDSENKKLLPRRWGKQAVQTNFPTLTTFPLQHTYKG